MRAEKFGARKMKSVTLKSPFVRRASLWRIIQWISPVIRLSRGCNNTSKYISGKQRIALDWSTICYSYTGRVIRAKGESWLNSLILLFSPSRSPENRIHSSIIQDVFLIHFAHRPFLFEAGATFAYLCTVLLCTSRRRTDSQNKLRFRARK